MDLSFLRSLVENPGPFLSVYLDTWVTTGG